MYAILAVTVPFFALVACGYLAARQRVLPESAIPGLNSFVLFFALPCLLFRFGASLPAGQLIDPVLVGIYSACALLLVLFTVAVTWAMRSGERGVNLRDAAFGALVAAFPNTGFMGVPMLVALMGQAAAGPVIGMLLVDMVLTSTLCLTLAQAHHHRQAAEDEDEEPGTAAVALQALRGALSNPMPWAIGLGMGMAALGWQLPGPVNEVVHMLANAASPVALFTIGAVVWRAGQHAHHHTPLSRSLPVAGIKLLLHPLLVLSMGLLAQALGAPVSAFGLTVMVLAAALPSASNVSLLAERFGADNGRVARIILASTLAAFVSFSLLAWGFGVQGR